MNSNKAALVPVRLQKALPRYGKRPVDLQCPAWIERQYRSREYARRLADVHKRERRAAMLEKLKIAIAGVVFVVVSLATAVVR